MSSRSSWVRVRLHGVLAVIALAAVISACSSSGSSGSGGTSNTTKSAGLTTVSMGDNTAAVASLPYFAAEGLGIFAKEGLKVNLINFASGAAAVAALSSNGIQFAPLTVPQVVNTRAQGLDIRLIAQTYTVLPQDLWCNDSVKAPHAGQYPAVMSDLKGVTVGVTALGTTTSDLVNYSVAAANLPVGTLKLVAVGGAASAIASLKSNAVDCVVAYEPMQVTLKSLNLGRSVLDWGAGVGPAIYKNYTQSQVGSTASWLSSNAATAKKMQAAIKAVDVFIMNPANATAVAKAVAPFYPGTSVSALTSIATEVATELDPNFSELAVSNAQKVGKIVGEQKDTLPYSEIVWNGS